MSRLDGDEVAKEVLGAMGYPGTERFFPEGGPKTPGTPQPPQEGELSEKDQAGMDQDFKKDQAKMDQDERRLEFDMKKHYDEMTNRAEERLLKKEITQKQFDEKMSRITTDRQNKVDEMRLKIRTGKPGI